MKNLKIKEISYFHNEVYIGSTFIGTMSYTSNGLTNDEEMEWVAYPNKRIAEAGFGFAFRDKEDCLEYLCTNY